MKQELGWCGIGLEWTAGWVVSWDKPICCWTSNQVGDSLWEECVEDLALWVQRTWMGNKLAGSYEPMQTKPACGYKNQAQGRKTDGSLCVSPALWKSLPPPWEPFKLIPCYFTRAGLPEWSCSFLYTLLLTGFWRAKSSSSVGIKTQPSGQGL